MATTTISETRNQTEAVGDQCVVLRDVGWEDYEALLRIRGDRSAPRMVYLDGSLLLMSPSFPHEHLESRFGSLVTILVMELNIRFAPSGSTTFRRRVKKGGVEPDLSYYFANEASVRGRKSDIDLNADPPPDLVIEVVWTHKADASVEVHRRLGVPEVWVWEKDRLRILHLDPNGEYAPADRSLAFPALKASEIESWVSKSVEDGELAWLKDFQSWVQRVLVPRHRHEGTDALGQP